MKHLKTFENNQNLAIGNGRYTIQRICWSDKTYNGYEDNPYWLINLTKERDSLGLNDEGKLWRIWRSDLEETPISNFIKSDVENIINECKLNIKLK